MAVKLATVNGNMTAAGTWQDVVNLRDFVAVQAVDQTMRGATPVTPGAIQIDGLIVKLAYRTDTTPSGTFSAELYNSTDVAVVAGTTVTINSSDVILIAPVSSQSAGWYYLKFAAPVTLVAGKAYYPRLSTSDIAQGINVCYSGTNYAWAFGFVLTGAAGAAPTTGDQIMICGAWTAAATCAAVTVTMDQTSSAVKYGTTSTSLESVFIGFGGTLTFGTAAATNYYMNVQAIFWVAVGGTLNVGTVATPVPRDSTAVLNFDITGSSGAYLLRLHGDMTVQGLSRTVGKDVVGCLLTAAHVAGGTTWTVDRDTGWKSGDAITVAPTQRAANKADVRTLTIDAGASTLTTAASSFDHAGSAATGIQAEVILTTRNVTIRVTTAAKNSCIWGQPGCSFDADWAAFVGMSYALSSAYRGISMRDPAAWGLDYCHLDGFNDTTGYGFSWHSNAASGLNQPYTFTNLTYERMADFLFYEQAPTTTATAHALTFTDIWGVGSGALMAAHLGHFASHHPVTITRFRNAGSNGGSPVLRIGHTDKPTDKGGNFHPFTIQDSVFHDSAYQIYLAGTFLPPILVKNCLFYRAKTTGSLSAHIFIGNGATELIVEDSQFLSSQHLSIYDNTNYTVNAVFRNCKWGGEGAYSQPIGFELNAAGGLGGLKDFRFENCLFGDAAGGIFLDHTTGDFSATSAAIYHFMRLIFLNCLSGSATFMTANFLASFWGRGFHAYQREGGVLGAHRIVYPNFGSVARDATFFRSAAPSEKMIPTNNASTSWRLQSAPKRFDVNTGSQKTAQVYVYLDPAYNGLAPRLIMKANAAIGQNADAVLATASGATGVWERLFGIMPVPSADDGQVEIFVDCTGTAGAVWCDDWGV